MSFRQLHVKIMVVAVGAIIILSIFVFAVGENLCDTEQYSIPSPDKMFEAKIKTVDCGAMDSGSTRVYLHRNSILSFFHMVYYQQPANSNLGVKWLDVNKLSISTDAYARDLVISNKWGPVEISFTKAGKSTVQH